MIRRTRRGIAWFVPAFLVLLGLFAMAQNTMAGFIFSAVLVWLALLIAATVYASAALREDGVKQRKPETRASGNDALLHVWPFILAVILASPACRVTPPPAAVPVQGTYDEVQVLAGEWSGRYWSTTTGRHGTIRFNLPQHADTGYGEVEITFSPSLRLLQEASTKDEPLPETCTVLDIKLVRVEGNRVRGTLAPYWDPDCDCQASTTFEGRISGNRIDGAFSTQRASSDRRALTGKWEATRERGTS